jgi:hypothetical protein
MLKLFAWTMLAAAVTASSATAQTACGDHDQIVTALGNKYKESPRAYGLVGQSYLLELFTSKEGSWTMLMSPPHGLTCILASGLSWEELPPDKHLTGL